MWAWMFACPENAGFNKDIDSIVLNTEQWVLNVLEKQNYGEDYLNALLKPKNLELVDMDLTGILNQTSSKLEGIMKKDKSIFELSIKEYLALKNNLETSQKPSIEELQKFNIKKLHNFIGSLEVNNDDPYNTHFFSWEDIKTEMLRLFTPLTSLNLEEILMEYIPTLKELQRKEGKLVWTPLWVYQINEQTLSYLIKKYNLDMKQKFTPEFQDYLALLLINEAWLLKFINWEISEDEFIVNLARTWSTLPADKFWNTYYCDENACSINAESVSVNLYIELLKIIRGIKKTYNKNDIDKLLISSF